ncbi:MAG TPA: HEAT repeat domain-containing protein [Kofleriaceae bacterium]|nr:HEAT repeat domain-containing protein [Kofleriaceae bacterium]
MSPRFASIETVASQADGALAQGRYRDAERCLRELCTQTHVVDYEYDDWLRKLAEVSTMLGRSEVAGYIYLYLHYLGDARTALADTEVGRARVLEIEKRFSEAADLYTSAHMPVHAAIAHERGKELKKAVRAWEGLLGSPALRDRPYEHALVSFNYGMAKIRAGGDAAAANRALADSMRRLEQVADELSVRGERERAFDCYQILLKIGRDSGQFENLAEGYLNCIRVLKEDNLKFYVLQYYEDFIKLADEKGELHAAATLYQEAADYAARSGLPYHRAYQAKAGDAWARLADRERRRGAPVELCENALTAAAQCFSAVGDYGEVKRVFEELAKLDLPAKKAERYRAIAARYAAAGEDSGERPELPEYLRQQHAYADIWFVDLLEWELSGDAYAVAASIVGDLRYPDGIRRRALVVILTLSGPGSGKDGTPPSDATLAEVAELFGELQSYAALSPLERLFEHDSATVRQAAVRALRFLFFKRSFRLVRRGLADAHAGVREAALEALGQLCFPHAMGPLLRIFRESEGPGSSSTGGDERVRAAALEAIGKIQTLEAGELLLMVLRQEQGILRDVARRQLAAFDSADLVPILRQHVEVEENPETRAILTALLG